MTAQIVCMFISAFLCLAAPAAAAIIMIIKKRGSARAFVLGIVVFSMTQLLIRLPMLNALQDTAWFNLFTFAHSFMYVIMLALSAGLFEEFGRFFGIKLFLAQNEINWGNAFVFGLGHAGAEAFALAGIPCFNLIVNTLSGRGVVGVFSTPAVYFLASGVERTLAVALHIGFSMLVFYAVKQRKFLYVIYAVAAHAIVDIAAPLANIIGLWESEAVLAAFAVMAAVLTVFMKRGLDSVHKIG